MKIKLFLVEDLPEDTPKRNWHLLFQVQQWKHQWRCSAVSFFHYEQVNVCWEIFDISEALFGEMNLNLNAFLVLVVGSFELINFATRVKSI